MNKLLLAFFIIANSALAADGIINGGTVTYVAAYETTDDSTRIFIRINGSQRVGPNPDYPDTNCELWTYTKDVYSLALTAKSTGQKVNIAYVANGDNHAYCKVRYIALTD